METATTGAATEAIGTAAMTVTETAITMETGSGTATATEIGIATVAAVTATVGTEKEAGETEMIGGVIRMGETGGAGREETEEMIALLSQNHQNVERAGGTTKEKV